MPKCIAAFVGEIISISGTHENKMPGGFGFNLNQHVFSHMLIGQSEKQCPGQYWVQFSAINIFDEAWAPVEGWDYTGYSSYGSLTIQGDVYELKTRNSIYKLRRVDEAEWRPLWAKRVAIVRTILGWTEE